MKQRSDIRYFLTMDYQEPDARGDSHDPYVVLNRWRTLLVTLEALDLCHYCEQGNADCNGDGRRLEAELEKQYQEVDQLFARINAFAEKAVVYFEKHAPRCTSCQERFHVGATAAQAMQDCIYENPETPDEVWLSESRCLCELFSTQRMSIAPWARNASLQNEERQADQTDIPVRSEGTATTT